MLARILALMLKELLGLWKDAKTRFVILAPPLLQVIIFAHAATYDVTAVKIAVWNEDRGVQASEYVRRFAASEAFRLSMIVNSPGEATRAINAKEVAAVLHLPQNFSADMLAGRPAHAQLLLDARRSNTALLVNGYATTITEEFVVDGVTTRPSPVDSLARDWFNPTLESQWFILPGLVAVLSLLMSMLISALSLARERELGTFEQLLVTPLRPAEILIGKSLPGIIVGLINANIVIAAAWLWFHVPFWGSFWLLQFMLMLYMLSGVGIGLVISSIARTQQQAMLGVFVLASPMVVLSGYAAPIENMPPVVEFLSRGDPVRYMLIAARGIFLQDMPAALALSYGMPLLVIGILAFVASYFAVRRAVS